MDLGPRNRCEKIFIIQMCRMGDVVQSLPLLKRLKEQRSPCQITLLCIRESIELIQDFPSVDRFVSVPYSYYKTIHGITSPSPKLDFLLSLPELQESYDLVVNLTHGFSSALICRAIRSKKKSGRIYMAENRVSVLGDWGKYLFSAVANRTNRLENLINLVDIHIGMGGLAHRAMDNWLNIGESEAKKADEVLISCGWKRSGRLVALQLGANQLHRAWPVGSFAALGAHLMRHPEVELLLLGSPGEKRLGEEFLRLSGAPAINLIGKTRIADLPSIVKKCDLLISNDTGTTHIAAAVGTKVLGLYFSSAYFAETAPFGSGHMAVQVETPCSPCQKDRCEETWCRDYLDVEAVKAAAEMMLSGAKGPAPDFPNLSIYESRFLSNGTLIYTPVTATVSERYQTGFINRMLWESALGLDHDQTFLAEFWPKLRPLEVCRSKLEACRRKYALMGCRYHDGLGALCEAALTSQSGPLQDKTSSAVRETLGGIDADIAAMGDSIMRTFHDYEMMDRDSTNSLEADRQMIEKYAKLYGMVNSFTRLLQPDRSEANCSNARRSHRPKEKAMKVLIVGPIAGGSLPVARAMASAFAALGYDMKFIDFSLFANEYLTARSSKNESYMAAFIEAINKSLTDQINQIKPDLFIGIAQAPLFDERILDRLRNAGVITTFWFVEDFRVLTYWKRLAPHFDIFFSIQKTAFPEALAEIGAHNHYYLPAAYNNNFDESPTAQCPRMAISFMGAPYPNRVRLFPKLTARFPLKIYGEGWKNHPVQGVITGERRITEAEARIIYRNTDVNLNIHSSMDPDVIGGDFVNPRTFEIAGMGCFQLSDRRELMPPLYAEDEIIRFGDEAELIEKIEYYLEHGNERKEIALNARRRTLRDHLYEHRVVEMINAVQKLSN